MKSARSDGGRKILSERSAARNPKRLDANKRDTTKSSASRHRKNISSNADDQNISSVINQNLTSSITSHKLDTIVSSDSCSLLSDTLSFEHRHLDDVNSPRSALMSAADEWYGRNDVTDERDDTNNTQSEVVREVSPPPPPPPPPSQLSASSQEQAQQQSSYVRLNDSDTRSVVSGVSALTSGIAVTRTFSQSQKQIASLKQQELSRQQTADHKKALLALLQQLKESETSHAALQKQYQSEKTEMMQHISKQEEHLNDVYKRLEAAEIELAKRCQKKDNASLVKVLMQLSKFANGCNDYAKTSNSASVKKMSDALKVQVGEWAKVHEVDMSNEQEVETSSMDMIHELQLEVKMLKLENAKLKKHSNSKSVRHVALDESKGGSASSVNSQGSKVAVDDSDEVSQLSGFTSMSSGTKMSALAAFPSDFDDRRSGKTLKVAMSPPPPPLRSKKSSRTPPRPGRKVHIHATPQILTDEEEVSTHEDFSVASSSPRSIMKKPTYSKRLGHSSQKAKPKRVLVQASPTDEGRQNDVITHDFADFDQAFGDDYSEV